MKVRRLVKIISIFLIVILLIPNFTFAYEIKSHAGWTTNQYMDVDQFDGEELASVSEASDKILGTVLNILRIVTFGCAVVVLIVYGIRYLLVSTENPERKAEIKKQLPLYCIGFVLLIASSSILKLVNIVVNDVLPTS